MANRRSNIVTPTGFAAWLGRLLMELVAGEDLRVRQVIARTVTHARSSHDLDLNTHWHARHGRAANPRAE